MLRFRFNRRRGTINLILAESEGVWSCAFKRGCLYAAVLHAPALLLLLLPPPSSPIPPKNTLMPITLVADATASEKRVDRREKLLPESLIPLHTTPYSIGEK